MKLSGTVLVTGGCGFIGANFIRYLFEKIGFSGRVVNLDKLTYAGHPENVAEIQRQYPKRYHFIKGDIADRGLLDRIFREFQVQTVVHFAAESHVDRSISGSAPFMETNILGTWALLESARLTWGDNADPGSYRFHHVSTDEVFGQLGPDDPAFTETTPYDPRSPYSASKASSDHLVRAWQHTYGLPVTISNCSNNYGPYQFPEKLIPVVILNAVKGQEIPVYGDGKNVRDWLFVADHCDAIYKILTAGSPGETYNIGGNCELANIDLVRGICDILDELCPLRGPESRSGSWSRGESWSKKKKDDTELIPSDAHAHAKRPLPSLSEHRTQNTEHLPSYRDFITFVTDRPGHDRRYAMDNGKIRRELGWEPATGFQDGIRRTIRWYLEHKEWLAAVQKQR